MVEFFSTTLALGALLIGIGTLVTIVLMVIKHPFAQTIADNSSFILQVILVGSILGSMTYELVFGYAPCLLCWYQRMAIFPLAVLVFTASIRNNKLLQTQVLWIASLGFLVSLVHNIIDIFPTGADICGAGPSCLLRYVNVFGFVTIPLMSAITLLSVIVITVLARRYPQK